MCGRPRIPGGFGGRTALTAVKEQQAHLGQARLASIATVVQGIFATFATLLGLALHPESLGGKGIIFALALLPLLLALRSRSRASSARAKAKEAGERAWQAAAEDVASRVKGGITVAALAEKLGVEEAEADRLLTSLTVHDRTRIDVGDDAEVRYSVAPEAVGVRVADLEASLDEELAEEALAPHAKKEPVR